MKVKKFPKKISKNFKSLSHYSPNPPPHLALDVTLLKAKDTARVYSIATLPPPERVASGERETEEEKRKKCYKSNTFLISGDSLGPDETVDAPV